MGTASSALAGVDGFFFNEILRTTATTMIIIMAVVEATAAITLPLLELRHLFPEEAVGDPAVLLGLVSVSKVVALVVQPIDV
jgi:hypothetical protein